MQVRWGHGPALVSPLRLSPGFIFPLSWHLRALSLNERKLLPLMSFSHANLIFCFLVTVSVFPCVVNSPRMGTRYPVLDSVLLHVESTSFCQTRSSLKTGINVFYIILGASQRNNYSSPPFSSKFYGSHWGSCITYSTNIYKDLVCARYCSRHWRYSSEHRLSSCPRSLHFGVEEVRETDNK